MDDLISRKAAIETVGINTWAGQRLSRLPSAEPQRKKGKWIKMSDVDGVYWACSECGEELPRVSKFDPQFDLFPRLKSIEKTNYCPNCGADMRGEENE